MRDRSGIGFSGYLHNRTAGYSDMFNYIPCIYSRFLPVAFLLLPGAIFFLALVSPATALDWTTETVDSTGDVGWYTSLDLDESGLPRISYWDWTNRHLKFAAKSNGIWINETVDMTNGVGEFNSLELDPSSQPFISYYDGNQGNLSFITKTGHIWTRVTVDGGGVGRYTSLELDEAGDPRIAYQDLANMKLKYAFREGGTWINETVDSGNVGSYSSLALDDEGNPGISYYDAGHGYLKYATKSGGLWSSIIVDTTGNPGYYTSLALDDEGNPGISYYDAVGRDLKFASNTGGAWRKETVDSAGNVGKWTSLSLDTSGNPHISYYDETNGHLKYAVKNGLVWTNETVDTGVTVGLYTSLALDDTGNPRISYRDSGNGDLKYAAGIPPLILDFTAEPMSGTAPLYVQFSDTTTGGLPSCWNWSFGDGSWFNTSVAVERNPEHEYEYPGTYNVTLVVRNSAVTAEQGKPGFITVDAPPVTTEPTSSPTPLPTSEEPTLTLTPTPSSSPTPEPTPSLTPIPSISPTPEPTPSLTPTPSSSPTPEPTPSLTPIPSISPIPEPTPSLTPTPSPSPTAVEILDSGSDDPPNLPPVPREAGPLVCLTVNVGGDSAIRSVTVTGRDISDLIISSRQVIFPPVPVRPDMTVFQYIELTPVHYESITAAVIDFDIPPAFIDNNHYSPDEVGLYMLRNGSWVFLSTRTLGNKNGMTRYRAESPEFSMFALALRNETFVTQEENAIPFIPSEDPVPEAPAAKPGTPVPPDPAGLDAKYSFMSIIIGIAGLLGLGIGAIIIRRELIRR